MTAFEVGYNLGHNQAFNVGAISPNAGSPLPSPVFENDSPSQGDNTPAQFNPSAGFIVYEFTANMATPDNGILLEISDGSNSNRVFIQQRSSGSRLRIFSAASGQLNEDYQGFLNNFPNAVCSYKLGLGYDDNNLFIYLNGMPLAQIEGNFIHNPWDSIFLSSGNGGSSPSTSTPVSYEYYDILPARIQMATLTRDVAMLPNITFDPTRDLYMLLGQSNSSGRAPISGAPAYTDTSGMFLLPNSMSGIVAYSDAYDDDAGALISGLNDTSAALGYAGYVVDALAASTGRDTVACPANLGGTSFEGSTSTWPVNSPDLRVTGTKITGIESTAMAAFLQCKMAQQFAPIKGYIWGQGEGDVAASTPQANYEAQLTALIQAFQFGVENSTWYNCSMPAFNAIWAPSQQDWDNVNDAQLNVANALPNVEFVEGTDIAGGQDNGLHYGQNENQTVGRIIANTIFDLNESLRTFRSFDGSQRQLDVTGSDFVSQAGGFMWIQATPSASATGDEYPLGLDDGSTSNLVAIRIFGGANPDIAGSWFRGSGGNISGATASMNGSGVYEFVHGSRVSMGISWNNLTGEAYAYSGGFVRTFSISARIIQELDRLFINGRNGNNAFTGTIHQLEVGNKYITPAQLEERIQNNTNRVRIAGEGQSLEVGSTNSQESGGQGGYDALISGLTAQQSGIEYMYRNLALGGSSVFQANAPSTEPERFWYNENTDSAGDALLEAFSTLDQFGIVPSYVSWSQGEADALQIGRAGRPARDAYKGALLRVFELTRERYGDVQFVLKIIGRRPSGNSNPLGTQAVRQAQLELIEEHDFIYFGAEQYHVALTDDVHPADVGYDDIFGNEAKQLSQIIYGGVNNPTGPEISSVTRSGTTITVTVNTSVFTPTTGIEGFHYFDSTGAEISITSATASSDLVTLVLSSTPTDSNGRLLYIFDREETLNISNVIRDADSMPLRTAIVTGV